LECSNFKEFLWRCSKINYSIEKGQINPFF
jgi:hypothetical protein